MSYLILSSLISYGFAKWSSKVKYKFIRVILKLRMSVCVRARVYARACVYARICVFMCIVMCVFMRARARVSTCN